MHIERNGVQYELTQQELCLAHEEYEHDLHVRTAKGHIETALEDLSMNDELPDGYQIDMTLLDELVNSYKEEIFSESIYSENWDCVIEAYLKSEGLKKEF